MTTQRTPQLNDDDLELLSAYIDQQVTPEERSHIEARIERDPVLRLALDELRATVSFLHELEPQAPPRSFTLDVATVAPRRSWLGAVRWMQLGSALAAVLLALSLTFEVTSTRVGAPAAMEAPASEAEPLFESAPDDTAGSDAAARAADEPQMQLQEAPAAEPAPGAAEEAVPEMQPAEAPAPQGPAADVPAAPPGIATDEGTTDGTDDAVQPFAEPDIAEDQQILPPQIAAPETQELAPPEPATQPTQPALSPLRLSQLALGALAVMLALGAWWLARRP